MKQKKKGGDKQKKMPLPVIAPAAPRQLGISVEDAVAEFRYRIDLIEKDFPHDPGMMKYRAALILAVEAIREKYRIDEEEA